jgi:CRISP-associated protein Cas1
MKRNYYIFSSGKLIRKQNTLYFEPGESNEPEETEESHPEDEEIEIEDENISDEENPANGTGDKAEELEPKKLLRYSIPIEDIETIYCFSEMRFNTRFLNFIAQKQITLHLFNYYEYYSGPFYPREPFISGRLLIELM